MVFWSAYSYIFFSSARKFEFVSEEELLSLGGDQDCCYCRTSVTASSDHLSKRHLTLAIHFIDGDTSK